MHFDGASFADGIDSFVSLPFEVDKCDRTADQPRNIRRDFTLVGTDLRLFTNDGAVDIGNIPAGLAHPANRVAQEDRRVRAVVLRVVVGEKLSNIWERQCAEDRVCDCVQKDIAIGMGDRTRRALDSNPAEHEGAPIAMGRSRFESMQVVAVPDPHRIVSPLACRLVAVRPQQSLVRPVMAGHRVE